MCKGTEKTLKCTAFDGVKRESFHDLQWKVRSGVSNWERIAFCNHKLNCTTTDDISNWTAFFAVNDVTNGSLTIKFLEEADLTFMCEVHKEDHGTPHNQETLRVERCESLLFLLIYYFCRSSAGFLRLHCYAATRVGHSVGSTADFTKLSLLLDGL